MVFSVQGQVLIVEITICLTAVALCQPEWVPIMIDLRLCEQIVTAGARDRAMNKFAHRCGCGQNNARVHFRRIRFGSRRKWLIDDQLQLPPDAGLSDLARDILLHQHGAPKATVLQRGCDLAFHFRRTRAVLL
jgi:hypothetical protein